MIITCQVQTERSCATLCHYAIQIYSNSVRLFISNLYLFIILEAKIGSTSGSSQEPVPVQPGSWQKALHLHSIATSIAILLSSSWPRGSLPEYPDQWQSRMNCKKRTAVTHAKNHCSFWILELKRDMLTSLCYKLTTHFLQLQHKFIVVFLKDDNFEDLKWNLLIWHYLKHQFMAKHASHDKSTHDSNASTPRGTLAWASISSSDAKYPSPYCVGDRDWAEPDLCGKRQS